MGDPVSIHMILLAIVAMLTACQFGDEGNNEPGEKSIVADQVAAKRTV